MITGNYHAYQNIKNTGITIYPHLENKMSYDQKESSLASDNVLLRGLEQDLMHLYLKTHDMSENAGLVGELHTVMEYIDKAIKAVREIK